MRSNLSHKELCDILYPKGYLDLAAGRHTHEVIAELGMVPDGIVSGMRWDDEKRDYVPTYKIATNRLGR